MPQLIPNGTYLITNAFSGFDLRPANYNAGSNIVTGQNDDTDMFRWTIFCTNSATNTYIITNKAIHLNAYVADNSGANTNVIISSSAQIFVISKAAGLTNTYNFHLSSTSNYWSVESTAVNAPVVLKAAANLDSGHQQFAIITRIGGQGEGFSGPLSNGRYRLKNQAANLRIRPKGAGVNSTIEPAVDDGSDNFQWQLTSTGTSLWTIQNVNNSLYVWMDPSLTTGSPAVMSTTTPAQAFTIVEVIGKTGIYTIQTPDQKYLGVSGSPSSVINGDAGTADAFQWAVTF